MKISAQPLTPNHETAIIDQFAMVLADMSSPEEMKLFLRHFFSETELLVFAKRLAVARQLEAGKSYEEIHNSLKVSTATISNTGSFVRSAGFLLALKKIELDEWAETMSRRFWPFTTK